MYTLTFSFFGIHLGLSFHQCLGFAIGLLPFVLQLKYFTCCSLPHSCCISRLPHSPWFSSPNNVC